MMTLDEFVRKFDTAGTIILLEGKRVVAADDAQRLTELGKLLATKMKNVLFRSGNADGADHHFSQGVAAVDRRRLQVICPYQGHRSRTNAAYDTVNMEDINLANEPDVIFQSKGNKKMEDLIDKYVAGNVDRFTIKAAYIIRDTVKVIGTTKIPPASFGIFYDNLAKPMCGGTGHTMNVCRQNNVPFVDQRTWFNWIA